ncbi:MAG TPA: hypothetical protein VL137_11960, partial [Polyangiaceae bacterium]|nr:hypothetical protein [Polyangiaceae bacterium]
PASAPTAAPATPASPTATATKPASKVATAPRSESTEPFDKSAAATALSQAASRASACRTAGDPSGTADVSVTFSPSGRVTQAMVQGPPFQGTSTGGCIARELRAAQVPAFAGDFVTVHKHVVIQ